MLRTHATFMVSSLLCFSGTLVHGAVVRVVTPDTVLENEDGNQWWTDATGPARSQSLLFANQFSSVPAGYHTIVGYALRLDGAWEEPVVASWDHVRFDLATTDRTGLSQDFESNYGSQPVVVFEGPATVSYEVSDSGPTNPFWDPFFRFQTPFRYNPATDGNLVFGFATTSGIEPAFHFDVQENAGGPVTFVVADSATAAIAARSGSANLVAAFFFIPEPSAVALATLACIGTLVVPRTRSWKRRRGLGGNGTKEKRS